MALDILVTNTNDMGAGSLRQAILDSNASAAIFDNILFNIPSTDPGCSSGVCAIEPATPYDDITDPVNIDGYSQPGSQENSNGEGQGLNAILTIELNGSQISNADGLVIAPGGAGSTIRGLVINRFGTAGAFGAGITIDNSSGNFIQGNFLGTDPSGTIAQGNQTRGIFLTGSSDNNAIGGVQASQRNLISGNNERGVYLLGDGTGNQIQGNLIGTDITGTMALGNDNGIVIQPGTLDTLVGGTQAGAGNVISGNMTHGIEIAGFAGNPTEGALIQGNFIGTDVTGSLSLGNGQAGIAMFGSAVGPNAIGGTSSDEGNIIAFNQAEGVLISEPTGQSILGNSIFENAGLGINLENGGNNDQAAPVLTSAVSANCLTTLSGNLTSTANTTFRLEFFSNTMADPSGNGEGMLFLDFLDVITDGAGQVEFSIDLPTNPVLPEFITATATDQSSNLGDTSEFSNAIEVQGPGVFVFSADNYTVAETDGSATITVHRICGNQGDVSVDYATMDGSATSGSDYTPAAGTLIWADQDSEDKSFQVEVSDDFQTEGDETVLLSLSNPTGGSQLGDPNTAVLTITDSGGTTLSFFGGSCGLNPATKLSSSWGLMALGILIIGLWGWRKKSAIHSRSIN